MSVKAGKEAAKKAPDRQVTFKCSVCLEEKPLQEMRSITRFIPVMVVCQACAEKLR